MKKENASFINTEITARNAGILAFVVAMTLLIGYLVVSNIRLNQRVTQLEERGAGFGRAGGRGFGRRMRGPGMAGGPQAMMTPGAIAPGAVAPEVPVE